MEASPCKLVSKACRSASRCALASIKENGPRKLQANILEHTAQTEYSCKDLEETVQKRWAMIADVPKDMLTR